MAKVENPENLPSGAKAHSFLSAFCGTTEEAAEKGLNLSETLEKHPAGAEAHLLLSASCGPTKVVPFLQNLPDLFSAMRFCEKTKKSQALRMTDFLYSNPFRPDQSQGKRILIAICSAGLA